MANHTSTRTTQLYNRRAGLLQAPQQRRRVFDHFFVTLQTVVDGFGLGIGPVRVLQADLAAGYVALVPFDADKTSSLTSFIEWLIAEGRE